MALPAFYGTEVHLGSRTDDEPGPADGHHWRSQCPNNVPFVQQCLGFVSYSPGFPIFFSSPSPGILCHPKELSDE